MNEEKSIIDLAKGRTPQSPTAENAPEVAPRPHQRQTSTEGDQSQQFSKIMGSLLENVQDSTAWREVELPSRNTVEIRPFNYEDEKLLRSINKQRDGVSVVTKLVQRCTKEVDIDSLISADFTFILFKLREMSYGNEYKLSITCDDCGGENELIVELDKLGVNYADSDLSEPETVTLPDSGKTVTIRQPLVRDSKSLEDLSKITENLWRFVTEIEGHKDRMIIQTFITKTTVKDVATIREAILKDDVGLDTAVRYVCKDCDSDNSIMLPMTPAFFTVS